MADFREYYKAREIITEILSKDLLGPASEDEILSERPTQYYILGKLYPQNTNMVIQDTARNPLLENEIETYDASVSLSNQKNPSSMAITCTLKKDVNELRISGRYAGYDPISETEAREAGMEIIHDKEMPDEKKKPVYWRRMKYSYDETIQLQKRFAERTLARKLKLQVYTHSTLKNGEKVITVVLINDSEASEKDQDEVAMKTVFQPVIHITGPDENKKVFTYAEHEKYLTKDPELQELDLLYSEIHSYGQGHGCSVMWDTNKEPEFIESTFIPSYNLHQMKPADANCGRLFSMKFLAEGKGEEIIELLREYVSQYRDWIKQITDKQRQLEDIHLKESAERNIKKCRDAADRITQSINLLEESMNGDGIAFRAFQLANEAMRMQRMQTVRKTGKEPKESGNTWYPFQLAFILHELSSFIEPGGEERKAVDLLWFPTGGGKTEAYLGIAAFVIFLRRLKNQDDDGVTVIMRYTLRLLTIQQFERASTLICACELMRQKYRLGGSEISIGLWVGGNLTPNTISDASANLKKKQNGNLEKDEADPCQVLKCPWCGEEIFPADYDMDIINRRMKIRCRRSSCEFHRIENGLPVHLIDEALYANLPAFIVATVDKFAQIPKQDKPAALFGISSHKNPPELIIQDELHLISGPLGTMTGIYEAAITMFCARNGINAKVIASTATIRNAENQIRSLYARPHTQFPPQGLTTTDSFFAALASEDEKPARMYLGILGVGASATTILIRVNAALLFATRYLSKQGFSDSVIDSFWTITGYFNSIRELGGARTQVMDDVQSRFSFLAGTKFKAVYPGVNPGEDYTYVDELTSRMDNQEITEVINKKLLREYKDGNHGEVYDFILASNMISVGVDVGRLGAMVVEGQPKTNAEYIQATSRVGRSTPGLVITVYNAARSRDRSHYEQFLRYHSALYRFVEATSLTPFSDRARDRGLHALYVSLVRYLVPGMLRNEDAERYDSSDPDIRKIEEMILDYVKKVDPGEYDAVKRQLRRIEAKWEGEAIGTLPYITYGSGKCLLKKDIEDDEFRTMNSMRNVDIQCNIYFEEGSHGA